MNYVELKSWSTHRGFPASCVLIELCRIEMYFNYQSNAYEVSVLIELCRIEIGNGHDKSNPRVMVLIELCRIEITNSTGYWDFEGLS